MKKKKKIIMIVMICLIISPYLAYKVYERWPTESWKMYDSLIFIWPRLKNEGIESIRFCWIFNPQTRFRGSGSDDIKGMLSFHVIDTNVVKWWTHYNSEVPKECLPEFINILDKAMKGMWWRWLPAEATPMGSYSKMLIITKKGKYIVTAIMDNSSIRGVTWKSEELKCGLLNKSENFIPPKEQIVSIVIFPYSQNPRHSRLLDFNPVALFGDQKTTEKLFGRPLEPKMIFEGRDEMEKIVDEYNTALKGRKQPTSDEYCLIFVTQDWFYWKLICIDANTVYDDCDMISESLKAYFDEIGLTKELLAK
jgi:hypothetical protein